MKNIRKALELMDLDHPNITDEARSVHAAALAEVEAIEKAAATIVKDATGDEWATPEDRADARHLMERIAKESK